MRRANLEKGFSLIVVLLLLAVGSIIALSSFRTTGVSESLTGSYSASERALMAAEYGASRIASKVIDEDLESLSVSELLDLVFSEGIEEGVYNRVSDDMSAHYKIQRDLSASILDGAIVLESVGVVISGDIPPGSQSCQESQGCKLISERSIVFEVGVDVFLSSPLNFMCPSLFDLPSSPSGGTGELEVDQEVDSVKRYNPAIAAGNLVNAARITAEIIGSTIGPDATPLEIGSGQNKAVLMKRGGVGRVSASVPSDYVGAVYHSGRAVRAASTSDYFDEDYVDYSACLGPGAQNSRMCSYLGGISSEYGAPALTSPASFHEFISSVFGDQRLNDVVYHDIPQGNPSFVPGKINIYTNNSHHVVSGGEGAGEFSGSPLAFSTDDFSPIFDESGETVLGYEAIALGGFSSSDFYEFSESSGELGPVLSGSDYLLVKDTSRDSGSPWGLFSSYLPSTQSYYIAGTSGGVSQDGSLLLEPSSSLNESGGLRPPVTASSVSRDVADFGNNFDALDDKGSVIIVDGSAKIGTSFMFNGLMVVLGDFGISGTAGSVPDDIPGVAGSLIVAPYYYSQNHNSGPDSWGAFICQQAMYDNKGGGRFRVEYDLQALRDAFALFTGDTISAWALGGGLTGALDSWRERVE